MVVNEYTGELKENTLDFELDLRSLAAPVLSMRDNEYVIPYGGKLVLNYHVCDYYGPEHPNMDGTVTVGKQGANTFTFIARLDEDTLDLDDVPEYKQTTLSGEQVMEIDVSGLAPGVHSILVQVISNGLASPTEWLKFRIKDADEDTLRTKTASFVLPGNIIDLSSARTGLVFSSSFSELTTDYIDIDTGLAVPVKDNGSSKNVMSGEYIPVGDSYKVCKRVIVADYDVYKNSDSELCISVTGKIYYTDINRFTGYMRYNQPARTNTNHCSYGPAVYKTMAYEDISGEYYLTNKVTSGNGTVYTLTDYLASAPSSVPLIVNTASIRNKIALTRLCEAVQAYFYGNRKTIKRCGVRLPNGMSIVTHYYGFTAQSGTDANNEAYYTYNYNIDGTCITKDARCMDCTRTKYPDRFILDLNGSTISALQIHDLTGGVLVSLANCYDTHIINGKIQGGYKYRKYSSIPSTLRLAEGLANINIYGSEFSSYENIDDYWSVGYDGECIGNSTIGTINTRKQGGVREYIWRIPFNQSGYIDLNGQIHKADVASDNDIVPRYTEGLVDYYDTYGRISSNETGTTNLYMAYNSLLHTVLGSGTAQDPYVYRGRKPFNDNFIHLHGGHNYLAKAGDENSGDHAFAYAVSMYIYFYKEFDPNSQVFRDWLDYRAEHNGELPDYEPLEFIKAYKIMPTRPFLVPKGAVYAHICATGAYNGNKWMGLNYTDQENYYASLIFKEHQSSWCSGYKNCLFHDDRTSILNNHYAYQCYVKGCYLSDMGSGRHQNQGGISNQGYNMDLEDKSMFAGNLVLSDVETVSGGKDTRFHHAMNLMFDNVRNYKIVLLKNIFKGVVKNSSVELINHLGYSHPIKFMRFNNNILSTVTTDCDGRGSGRGITFLENSSVEKVKFNDTKHKATVVNKSNGSITTTTNIE